MGAAGELVAVAAVDEVGPADADSLAVGLGESDDGLAGSALTFNAIEEFETVNSGWKAFVTLLSALEFGEYGSAKRGR